MYVFREKSTRCVEPRNQCLKVRKKENAKNVTQNESNNGEIGPTTPRQFLVSFRVCTGGPAVGKSAVKSPGNSHATAALQLLLARRPKYMLCMVNYLEKSNSQAPGSEEKEFKLLTNIDKNK